MKCQILVDWLTFSVKRKEPKEVIREFLGLNPALFQEEGYGLMGYTRVLKFSNILVCYAPREGYLTMDEIVRKIQSNEVNSRMAKRSVIVSYDGARRGGTTVYLGAPSSDFRVRIYDKAKAAGGPPRHSAPGGAD